MLRDPAWMRFAYAKRAAMFACLGWSYLAYAYTLGPALLREITPCPFRMLTDVRCPLCGLTHAWHAALHGDWADAFAAHAVAPLLLPIGIAAILWFSFTAVFHANEPPTLKNVIRRLTPLAERLTA